MPGCRCGSLRLAISRWWLSYSVGMTTTGAVHVAVLRIPATAWTVAVEPGGGIPDGAWVAALDGYCFKGWRAPRSQPMLNRLRPGLYYVSIPP